MGGELFEGEEKREEEVFVLLDEKGVASSGGKQGWEGMGQHPSSLDLLYITSSALLFFPLTRDHGTNPFP